MKKHLTLLLCIAMLASMLAAAYLAEKVRAWKLGFPGAMNTRATYTAYPNMELIDTMPKPRRDCPDCKAITPPDNIRLLSGSVLELTLSDALRQISDILGTDDYELLVHMLFFGGIVGDYIKILFGLPV